MLTRKISEKISDISPIRLIVSSFFIIIILGAIFLTMPISSRSGQVTNFLDCLFVATSCTCVTGLNLFDTWCQWTEVGQFIMLVLIQLGGLGLVTFTTGFALAMRGKLGLRDMQIVKEYTSGSIINITGLIKTILGVTFLCEAIGAILLSYKFVPEYGVYGWWISIFSSVSAYCNAGFDILGISAPGTSLCSVATDPLVGIVMSLLIILGGLGFIVIIDVYSYLKNKVINRKFHYSLNTHSYIVLKMTALLLILGFVLFLLLEYDNTLKGMNFFQKCIVSFFQSSTARTAGFFSVEIPMENDLTKLMTCILMFIGASPSSTGGGIKTTTFVVLVATVVSVLKGDSETTIRRKIVDKNTVYKSLSIAILGILIVIITTSVISWAEAGKNLAAIDIVYEAVSAFSTTGLSAGITPLLTPISKIILILTMFVGRVGPISLILALTLRHTNKAETVLPQARIIVG